MVNLITEHIDIWTAAQTQKTNSGRGRGKNSNGQSPHGIKKLRELILELAVRGKLVPQDPNNEPASKLLEKVAKEKAMLIKEGKIKKDKKLPEITDDEKPFDLPQGWAWAMLGEIAQHNSGKTLDKGRNQGESREYITTSNLYWGYFILGNLRKMPIKDTELEKCTAKKGDFLICEGGEAGRASVWDYEDSICFQNHIHRVRFFCEINPYYAYRFFEKLNYTGEINNYRKGVAISNMSGKVLSSIIIPLPPLAEQHLIVSKIDELMALCDQIEQQQTDSNATHQTLVETLLATLTTSADQSEFAKAWQRIANHFDTLFTTEQSIDQLKQTILQLAVMGKLVPQDPNDEPVSILLKKITKEKARLIKEGKIKKQKPLPEISEEERPFKLPIGWNFVRLVALSKLITKGSSPKWQGVTYTDTEDILFVTSENVGSYILKLDSRKYVEKKFNEVEPRSILQKGDFLMNIVGASIGRTAIYNIDDLANINQAVCLIRVFPQFLDSQYLLHFFNSEICVSYMFDKQVDNARANLSMGNIAKFVIPFPPLAEQNRIVAKVDELMALCDTLKARLNDAQTTRAQLADGIVEQAVA